MRASPRRSASLPSDLQYTRAAGDEGRAAEEFFVDSMEAWRLRPPGNQAEGPRAWLPNLNSDTVTVMVTVAGVTARLRRRVACGRSRLWQHCPSWQCYGDSDHVIV